MNHSINYYVSKIDFYINDKFPSLFDKSILNGFNIKALLGVYIVLLLALIVAVTISTWKLFEKDNKPGYYALIPGLNLWMLFKLSGLKGYFSLIIIAAMASTLILLINLQLMYAIIPLIIIIGMSLWLFIKLSITYKKNLSYSFGLLFLPLLFFPILAFDTNNNDYVEIVELN